ncbi:MAG TPA: TatD family hydrolase [Mycobacteriales bacterium]
MPPPAPQPLPADAVDSHCHLDAMGCRDDADVARVVAAAQAVGIRRVVTVGDTIASSRWCAETAAGHPDVHAAVAVHPNEVGELTEDGYAELARLAALPQVRAVGETGLDYYWGRVDPAEQKAAFRRHIALAKDVGKPLVIHDRDAHDDVLAILDEEGAPRATVMHCFSGDRALAQRCVDAGYVLSFAGTVTFKNAPALREAAAVVPPGQLLAETDAPFLTPMPYRGRPNAPYLLPLTIGVLAEVTGRPLAELCATMIRTAEALFGPF